MNDINPTHILQSSLPREQVSATVDDYLSMHAGSVQGRQGRYTDLVNHYYDLVTDFYEYGWGQSFHFAPRFRGETFDASLARHEHYLALLLGLRPGMRVLDVGCGVGGPMRAIARFSGATVVGINNNDYQIKRARAHNERAGLSDRCDFIKADFMKLPLPDQSVDAVFSIEATCHAPDRAGLFAEILRVLKPGARFASYEWCLTDRYDDKNPQHREIKKGIEEGDALPDLVSTKHVEQAMATAGFHQISGRDLVDDSDSETPWYLPLSAGFTVTGFKHTQLGRWVTGNMVRVLERTGVAPRGTIAVSDFLQRAATSLVAGGKQRIFTPMYLIQGQRP